MILELMSSDGTFRAVRATARDGGGDAYVLDGDLFEKYREVARGVTAYARTPSSTPFAECVLLPLPMPLGKALYPAPVLWATTTGLGAFVTDEKKRKVTLRGLFSSWEESDDDASEADDGALLEDDPVDSENDELADEIVSDEDDVPSEDDEQQLQDD
jgi:hypothetical protein